MISYKSNVESEALDEVEKRLSQDGYTIIRNPSSGDLPQNLQSIQPDAIAIGRDPKLLIEVINRRSSDTVRSTKIVQLQHLLADTPGWKLHVIYIQPSSPRPTPASAEDINHRLGQIRQLGGLDLAAALVMAWSLLEATTRLLLPGKAARALTPATTVELLASLGYVTQSEAEVLREAGRQRNLIVHGDFTVAVATGTVNAVLELVEAVLSEGPPGAD